MELIYCLYRAEGNPPATGTKICYLTGLPAREDGPKVGEVLRDTFTNHDLARAPGSPVMSDAAQWYFNHQEFRRFHIVAERSGESYRWRSVAREDLRQILVDALTAPPDCDRFYSIALSKKKHIALRAPVTPARSAYVYVQFEENAVTLAGAIFLALLTAFDAALALGISKKEILCCQLHILTLQKLVKNKALGAWQAQEKVLRPHVGSQILPLVSFVIFNPTEKEEADA